MDDETKQDNFDTEIGLLRGILSEVQDLNSQLARTDQRSRQNSSDVETLREDRISPLEKEVVTNSHRSRRNSLILSAAITIITIAVGGAMTYGFAQL